ncbi:hypothetical protein OPV22_000001 [Ensete ventricosum]|uniref:Conserved Oligomeric Golgi complex subunit 6 C-terminal domain-containing protein n=1 Tax=Ensete ventricosum TaxID=4639 RepID=A0AAV8RSA0_ENSVE|nr:hypothetical protein OPV22_000001 [Ensete ventricosum]
MTPPEIGDCGVSSANGGHRRTAKATAVPSSTDVSSLQCLPRATAVAACPRLQNQTPPPFCYLCVHGLPVARITPTDGEHTLTSLSSSRNNRNHLFPTLFSLYPPSMTSTIVVDALPLLLDSFMSTTGLVHSFRPKANSQHDDKELGAEQSILLNTSGDGECVQSGDIDVRPNVADSKEQASTELSSMDFLYDLSHSSGATGKHQVPSQLSAGDDLVVHYGLRWVQAECKKLGDNDNPEDGFIRLWHLKGLIISYKLSYTLEFYCHTISDLLGRETALCNTRWLLEDAAQQTFFNILKGRGETLKVPSTGRG